MKTTDAYIEYHPAGHKYIYKTGSSFNSDASKPYVSEVVRGGLNSVIDRNTGWNDFVTKVTHAPSGVEWEFIYEDVGGSVKRVDKLLLKNPGLDDKEWDISYNSTGLWKIEMPESPTDASTHQFEWKFTYQLGYDSYALLSTITHPYGEVETRYYYSGDINGPNNYYAGSLVSGTNLGQKITYSTESGNKTKVEVVDGAGSVYYEIFDENGRLEKVHRDKIETEIVRNGDRVSEVRGAFGLWKMLSYHSDDSNHVLYRALKELEKPNGVKVTDVAVVPTLGYPHITSRTLSKGGKSLTLDNLTYANIDFKRATHGIYKVEQDAVGSFDQFVDQVTGDPDKIFQDTRTVYEVNARNTTGQVKEMTLGNTWLHKSPQDAAGNATEVEPPVGAKLNLQNHYRGIAGQASVSNLSVATDVDPFSNPVTTHRGDGSAIITSVSGVQTTGTTLNAQCPIWKRYFDATVNGYALTADVQNNYQSFSCDGRPVYGEYDVGLHRIGNLVLEVDNPDVVGHVRINSLHGTCVDGTCIVPFSHEGRTTTYRLNMPAVDWTVGYHSGPASFENGQYLTTHISYWPANNPDGSTNPCGDLPWWEAMYKYKETGSGCSVPFELSSQDRTVSVQVRATAPVVIGEAPTVLDQGGIANYGYFGMIVRYFDKGETIDAYPTLRAPINVGATGSLILPTVIQPAAAEADWDDTSLWCTDTVQTLPSACPCHNTTVATNETCDFEVTSASLGIRCWLTRPGDTCEDGKQGGGGSTTSTSGTTVGSTSGTASWTISTGGTSTTSGTGTGTTSTGGTGTSGATSGGSSSSSAGSATSTGGASTSTGGTSTTGGTTTTGGSSDGSGTSDGSDDGSDGTDQSDSDGSGTDGSFGGGGDSGDPDPDEPSDDPSIPNCEDSGGSCDEATLATCTELCGLNNPDCTDGCCTPGFDPLNPSGDFCCEVVGADATFNEVCMDEVLPEEEEEDDLEAHPIGEPPTDGDF